MSKALKILLIIFIPIISLCLICFVANKINMALMNDYIDTFTGVQNPDRLTVMSDESGVSYFVTDRDFKLMHLTDIHIGGGFLSAGKDKKVINAVAAMVNAEKPDLVIITGDISFAVPWTGTNDNAYAHRYFIRLMENLGVAWTVTLGNHDSEAYNFRNRASVSAMYSSSELKYCLYDSAEGLSGEGNHVINVKNGDGLITQSFYMLDSHAYTDKDPFGLIWDYDYIKQDQIDWYKDCVMAANEYNTELLAELSASGKSYSTDDFSVAKSMMFFHIPLREVKYAYDEYVNNNRQNTENTTYIEGNDGESDEIVYCSRQDEDLFETVLELCSTRAMFYGHDHLNNFVLNHKGVILSYGYSMDYLAYSGIAKRGYQRGCAVITCSPDTTFKIIHENYYQDKYVPLYEKETVDMTK